MLLKDSFRTVDSRDNFYFADNIEMYGLSIKNAVHILTSLTELCKRYEVDIKLALKIIKKLHIENRHLFDYAAIHEGTEPYNKNMILVRKKGIFVEKRQLIGDKYSIVNVYYDIYLIQHQYISTVLHKIEEEIFKHKFSTIYSSPLFLESVRRFPEELRNVVTPLKKISDISCMFNLTCKDIYDLLSHPKVIDSTIIKSKFAFYGGDTVYLSLGIRKIHNTEYPDSLGVPIKALLEKDWKQVENHVVHSIIKNDANDKLGRDSNNWYEGVQKDSPYFNHPLVEALKDFIIE